METLQGYGYEVPYMLGSSIIRVFRTRNKNLQRSANQAMASMMIASGERVSFSTMKPRMKTFHVVPVFKFAQD